ncbi:CLUMA_CG012562, isoform A [Clunio marinus]|uniref:Ubiquitin carboxyl-terminal hydrolase MINDY n=1 Tax=Clunio marinus TaxID=568069 RepID=A0A1J1IHT9_9DIPT|nr:CLUMA_CG012562, isoform A [Clunio marinus]
MSRPKLIGGRAITATEAIEIRQTVFGSASAPPRGEWTRTGITFGHHNAEYPFGLRSPKNATRGLQSVIQAFIVKYFIFDNRPKEKSVPLEHLLKPSETEQVTALWTSISEILWNIGEKTKTIVCLPGELPHIGHSHAYFQDNVTEKLWMFEFNNLDDLQIFIKRYIFFFTDDPSPGALLFLYSAVWTRGFENVRNDLDASKGSHLMGNYEEGSLNIVTLLLSGRATPYLHNGVIYVGDEDHYALPQFGILSRSRVGLLIWDGAGEALRVQSRQPGSRLKTPALPVWVTSCMGHYGVIFNSNRELLRNYHAEKRFELHHYTCAGFFVSMTVDNRGQDDDGGANYQRQNTKVDGKESDAGVLQSTPIEKLIQTKWAESKISFLSAVDPAKMTL